ncbi:MAG: hypothetical protein ACJ762_09715 [Solirubrobacteraceae bacterium]
MRHGRSLAFAALCLLGAAPSASAADTSRYALANGCYSLTAGGDTVAGPFRMKATDLGSYMLYTEDQQYFARNGAATTTAAAPSGNADWLVEGTTGAFTLTVGGAKLTANGKTLSFGGAGSAFGFAKADGCPAYPESEVGVSGAPSKSASPWGVVGGMLDAHMHWMAFEFLGGKAHCGKPWDRYGITVALQDCPDHSVPGSPGNVLEAALGGPATHATDGWPTFSYWPNNFTATHEETYYKWVERAWRGGLRLFVNLYVDNAALCKVYPLRAQGNKCNEMDTVRLEHQRLLSLRDYADAQAGGPGKGFFQIVTTPFEARRVIASGKLAVLQGIEVSELFDCTVYNGVENCDKDKVDRNLDEVYKMGVRGMELVNKFDNAFVGVAGDNGTQGVIVNNGNKLETGRYWDMQTCQGLPAGEQDKDQISPSDAAMTPGLVTMITSLFPTGGVPVYPPTPHCNQRGLSSIGQYLVTQMMNKGMIIDPDHMSVAARNSTLDMVEARRYGGIVSSHSWSTPLSYQRILKLGGVVTPIASSSKGMVEDWKTLKAERNPKYYFGFGWGADFNGFHKLGSAREGNASNPIVYPFKSWDGKQTLSKLTTGQKSWDVNKDGVANYGLFPDWVADTGKVGGDAIVKDFGRGAEAYLEMWERAAGVPEYRAVPSRSIFSTRGLFRVKLGATNEALLRSAGQPKVRGAFVWKWGIQKRPIKTGTVYAVIGRTGRSTLVASTGLEHQADGVNVGDSASKIDGGSSIGPGVRYVGAGGGKGYVFGVKGGQVAFTGVTSLHGGALRAALAKLPV